MMHYRVLSAIALSFSLVSGIVGCASSPQQSSSPPPVSPTATPAAASATAAKTPTESPKSSARGSTSTTATMTSAASTTASTVEQFAAARPPLTVEKLKNTEYYFLAKGPIKLVNGTYEDKVTRRTYTLSEVVAYGDINKDGVKDAVTALKVTIPETGNFSYLVALVNEAGAPKNVSVEFMGPQVQVKTLKVKADNAIEAVMGQYQAGDPECCPSIEITRTYKLRANQAANSTPAKK